MGHGTERGLDYDRLAGEYARHRRVHPGVLRALIEGARLGPDARVLEVGCGTGNYSHALTEQTGCRVWGIDPSAAMLAQARAAGAGPRFQQGRAEALDFDDAHFDLIFSVDVIHHVGDRAAVYREAARTLVDGGLICTVTDSDEIIPRRRPLSSHWPETIAVERQRYPAIATLRAEMSAAGLGEQHEATVELHYDLQDARAYRERAFSSLHLIAPAAFERGLARLEAELRAGPVACLSLYLLLWGRCGQRAAAG